MVVLYCWTCQSYVQRTTGTPLDYFDVNSDAPCVSAFIVPAESNAFFEG